MNKTLDSEIIDEIHSLKAKIKRLECLGCQAEANRLSCDVAALAKRLGWSE